jgi:hypothetical protein
MKDSITPAEMIQWFKSKAIEFNRIANVLESTFSPSGLPIIQSSIAPPVKSSSDEVSAEDIKTALETFGRTARSSKIAEHLKVEQAAILPVLSSNPEMFEQVGRGWWKNK